jgi:class 3 adenylate cyclase/tetratricopeptide (TPR) repeat protein
LSDIEGWLTDLGLAKYAPAFAEAEIDFGTLPDLVEDDLKDLGLPLGPRRKIWGAINRLGEQPNQSPPPTDPTTAAPVPQTDAERRHLTVMFVDLVGSTEMATRIDAEDMRDVITGYQNTVAGLVSRFEGFVAKFMGDGVLCYFGWPRAGEDDAERAVRAGLAIIEAVKKTKAPDGAALSTRVGIATGVVIVGDLIGSGATQEAAVVGETPNLAARLQGVAGLNQLVISEDTKRLLGVIFDMTPVGAQALKGIAAPVQAFAVNGETAQESRFAAQRSGTLTPIVGREREVALMLERWALARSGQGQMIVVSGEAGIGKSRITQAVIDEISGDDHVRMTYQCSPYHADSAFYPVTQQMAFAAGFAGSDTPDQRLDKMEALIGGDPGTCALVAALLGIDGAARYGALELSPAQQRARTMRALAGLLVRQAQDRPLLLVFEDLHWIDPTSLELLEVALDTIADEKVLVLSTARPTFEHGFGGHPIVTRFALNRLGKDQIGAIVAKLTGGKALPDEIMAIIAQRTDGVPLFVEELTKTILESGALKEDGDRFVLNGPLSAIAIPTTLHDSLMARLDRLHPIKEVAQTAACIGREFSHRLLTQVSHLPEAELTVALDGLIEAELIYRRGLPPEATYLFKHALVRDAAYESLLRERRRAIHTRILTALETAADIAPEVRATHAEAANLTARAIDLWEAASKAAIARPAFDEAISHLGHAITLIAPQLDSGDIVILNRALSLQVQLGIAFIPSRGYSADETRSAFDRALGLADRIGETPLRFTVLYGLWVGMYVRGEHAGALAQAEALVRLAGKSSDGATQCLSTRLAGVSLLMLGRFCEAENFFQESLSLFDPVVHKGLENLFGQDLGVASQVYIGWNAYLLGETQRSQRHLRLAETGALATCHVNTICYMHAHMYIIALKTRDEGAVRRHSEALSVISSEHHLVMWSGYALVAQALVNAGEGDRAGIDAFYRADASMIGMNARSFIPAFRIEAARRALALGLNARAEDLAAMAEDLMGVTGDASALSDLHRLKGALAIERGDVQAAETCLMQAIRVAKQQGSPMWELRASIDLARLLQDQGRTDEAIALLRLVHTSIADGDCPEDQVTARDLLAELAG